MLHGLIVGLTAVSLLLIAVTMIEFVAPIERYSLRSRIPGVIFSTVEVVVSLMGVVAVIWVWKAVGVEPLVSIPVSGFVGGALAVLLAVLLGDFVSYWNHRLQHRFLWPIHVVHHSQTELHAANGYGHFMERPLQMIIFGTPLALIDLQLPAAPYAVGLLMGVMQRYIHSPTSAHLGLLNNVVVDNRWHRIHHSLEPRHFDKNFGIFFSFWDRLFGTAYQPAPGEWPATGVEGYSPPTSIRQYALYPLRFIPPARAVVPLPASRLRLRPSDARRVDRL